MSKKRILQLIALIFGLTAFTLAWIFFSWKLVLVLFLALWGNNIETKQ